MAFDAAIFDMDGLLIDTERMMVEAGVAAAAQMGTPLSRQVFLSTVGVDRHKSTDIVAQNLPQGVAIEAFDKVWRRQFDDMLDAGIPLRPGAADLLNNLVALQIPRAIATNALTEQAHIRLEKSGLAAHFEHVVGFDLVERGKPDPGVYLEAARRLGVDPKKAVAFEDSDHGAAAAWAAGMRVVQVPDLGQPTCDHAHHAAPDLITGARAAGLFD